MIRGMGTDMVDIARIGRAMERHGERFALRILSAAEYRIFVAKGCPPAWLAKRFAAKEAASKALGTGIGAVSWHDIEIANDTRGAPCLAFHGGGARRLAEIGACRAWLSLSDEAGLALAFVVLEGE
ncbi:MAG: holo-ACP synthase [Porticoccaceae bacterium]|nr:holo-ACP synthase [Porticoccaceae bacterium]